MSSYCSTSLGWHYDVRSTRAGSIDSNNTRLNYGHLAQTNAEKLMGITCQYAAHSNQTIDNLAHLRADQMVEQWRDSTYGNYCFPQPVQVLHLKLIVRFLQALEEVEHHTTSIRL